MQSPDIFQNPQIFSISYGLCSKTCRYFPFPMDYVPKPIDYFPKPIDYFPKPIDYAPKPVDIFLRLR
jgi:hypothetical protein